MYQPKDQKKPKVFENEGAGEQSSQSEVYNQNRLQTLEAVQNRKCQTFLNRKYPVANEERPRSKCKKDVNTIRPSSNIMSKLEETPRYTKRYLKS